MFKFEVNLWGLYFSAVDNEQHELEKGGRLYVTPLQQFFCVLQIYLNSPLMTHSVSFDERGMVKHMLQLPFYRR